MDKSICGVDCCNCSFGKYNNCKRCNESNGCPFGKQCFIFKYIKTGGTNNYQLFKKELIDEFNSLHIPGMPAINDLNALVGSFVNLEYKLPNGQIVKYLDDQSIYLGNQLECEFGGDRCYGIVAGMDFLLVCTYGENGTNPELVMYKKR